MMEFRKTKGKVLEAVATARDEAIVKFGKAAASRVAAVRRRRAGKIAVRALVAGGAIAAGTWAVRAYKQSKYVTS